MSQLPVVLAGGGLLEYVGGTFAKLDCGTAGGGFLPVAGGGGFFTAGTVAVGGPAREEH
jgi:hypothetical protein